MSSLSVGYFRSYIQLLWVMSPEVHGYSTSVELPILFLKNINMQKSSPSRFDLFISDILLIFFNPRK